MPAGLDKRRQSVKRGAKNFRVGNQFALETVLSLSLTKLYCQGITVLLGVHLFLRKSVILA